MRHLFLLGIIFGAVSLLHAEDRYDRNEDSKRTLFGFIELQNATNGEMSNVARALRNVDQSYSYRGFRGCGSCTAGSVFVDWDSKGLRKPVGVRILPPKPVILSGARRGNYCQTCGECLECCSNCRQRVVVVKQSQCDRCESKHRHGSGDAHHGKKGHAHPDHGHGKHDDRAHHDHERGNHEQSHHGQSHQGHERGNHDHDHARHDHGHGKQRAHDRDHDHPEHGRHDRPHADHDHHSQHDRRPEHHDHADHGKRPEHPQHPGRTPHDAHPPQVQRPPHDRARATQGERPSNNEARPPHHGLDRHEPESRRPEPRRTQRQSRPERLRNPMLIRPSSSGKKPNSQDDYACRSQFKVLSEPCREFRPTYVVGDNWRTADFCIGQIGSEIRVRLRTDQKDQFDSYVHEINLGTVPAGDATVSVKHHPGAIVVQVNGGEAHTVAIPGRLKNWQQLAAN